MTSSTEASRAARSAPRGTSKGTRASASVRLARTMRWAMVGSGTRKARAISSVVEPAEQPQRQRDAGLGRQDRMAGGEDQPQQIVAQIVVVERARCAPPARPMALLPRRESRAELFVLAPAACRAAARRWRGSSRWPSARRRGFRGRRSRPPLERRDQRVLSELLGQADVAHHARQGREEPGRLDPPQRLNPAPRLFRRGCHRPPLPLVGTRGGSPAAPAGSFLPSSLPASIAGPGAKYLQLEEGAQLDLGHVHGFRRDALGPLDGLLAATSPGTWVSHDHLLRLGERTVDDGALAGPRTGPSPLWTWASSPDRSSSTEAFLQLLRCTSPWPTSSCSVGSTPDSVFLEP